MRNLVLRLLCLVLGLALPACGQPMCSDSGQCNDGDYCAKASPEVSGICAPLSANRCAPGVNPCKTGETCYDSGILTDAVTCTPAMSPADPCATNNGGCPMGTYCVWPDHTQMVVSCQPNKPCVTDAECGTQPSNPTFCDNSTTTATPATFTCLPKHKVGETCARPAPLPGALMCETNLCNAGNSLCGCKTSSDCLAGQTCDASHSCVAAPACTSDTQCNTATEFCNAASKCEAKHPIGGTCDRATNPAAMCVFNQCNADKTCGCTDNNQCTTTSGFKCDLTAGSQTINRCVPDSASTAPYLKICALIKSPTGGAATAGLETYHLPTPPGNTSQYASRTPMDAAGKQVCITLTAAQVCGRLSLAFADFHTGPSGPTVAGFVPGTRKVGLEVQVINSSNQYSCTGAGCSTFADMVSSVTVEGLNRTMQTQLALTTIDPATAYYGVISGVTSPQGNLWLEETTYIKCK